MNYKKILDLLPVAVYVTQDNGIEPTFFNKTWYKFTGLTEKETSSSWKNFVDPHDVERVDKVINDAVSKNEGYEVELRIKNVKNESIWCLTKACPFFDDNGQLEGYVGTTIDISDRKLAIRDMEEVYENVLHKRQQRIEELEGELNGNS
jgi:PAS domain S-box-containing protein